MERISKMWRSGLAMLLALCLLISACPIAAFATESDEVINYVSLGDSMTNGYCFTGYNQGSISAEQFLVGEGVYGDAAYPNDFAAYLAEQNPGKTVKHNKLAVSAMRAEDLNYLLGGREMPTDGWFSQVEHYSGTSGDALKGIYQEAITDADVITMGIGNAAFGAYMVQYFTRMMGVMGGSLDEDEKVNLEAALAVLEPEQKAAIMNAYNQMMAKAAAYIPAELGPINVQDLIDMMTYIGVSFLLNYEGALERIVALNPDVEVVLVGLMNTTYGMVVTGEGFDPIPIGDIVDILFDSLNAYIAGLPAVMQAAGEWEEAKFYYAAQPQPEFIVQVFDDLYNEGWPADYNGLSGATVRARTIKAYNEALRPMIGLAMGLNLPAVDLTDAQKYVPNADYMTGIDMELYTKWSAEANTANYFAEKQISIAIYLALEEALAISVNSMEITLEGLMGIAGDIFGALGPMPEELSASPAPITIKNALVGWFTGSDTALAMCKIFAMFKVGDGMSVHPTPAAHAKLEASIEAAYGKHTAKDETEENIKYALTALKDFLEKYGPDAAEQAYQYLVEEGYIDAAQAKADELIVYLTENAEKLKAELIPAVEAAIAELEVQYAELKVELETLKKDLENKLAEMENAASSAAVAQIEAAIKTVEALIAQVEKQIAELNKTLEELVAAVEAIAAQVEVVVENVIALNESLTALVETLKNTSKLTVEALAAAYEAAREVVLDAMATLEAAMELVDAQFEKVDVLVELYNKQVAAIHEHVNATLNQIKAEVSAEVQVIVDAAIQKIQKDLEVVAEKIEAELQKALEELKAEMAVHIAAKQAELQAVLDAIDAHVAEKAAELIAAAEAEVAALEAEAEKKIAELKAAAEAQIAVAQGKVEELKAHIAQKQAELIALNEQLQNAVEDTKAQIEAQIAIVEAEIAALQAELEAAVAELNAAVAELNAKVEAVKAELNAKVEAVKAELNAKVAAIRAEVEAVHAAAMAAIENEIAKLEAELDAKVEELKAAAEAELAKLAGMAANEAAKAVEAAVAHIEEQMVVVDAMVEELTAVVNCAFVRATTSDLVLGRKSVYVALGDGTAASKSYVELVGARVKENFHVNTTINYAEMGNTVGAEIEKVATREGIADAALITIGFSNVTMLDNAIRNAGRVNYDWAKLVGEEMVPVVDEALAAVYAKIAEIGMTENWALRLHSIVEGLAYAAVEYAIALPELIAEIRTVNTDAVIMVVGQYNPMAGVALDVGGATVDVSDYIDGFVDAVAAHGTGYALITGEAIFVEASEVDTANTDLVWTEDDLIFDLLLNGFSVLYPSEAGDLYIANQILGALNIEQYVPANPFVDVPQGSWFYEAVMWAVEMGITNGTGDGTTFEPNVGCTRAQIATFLWRFAGCPAPKSSVMPFTDVATGKYYTEAIIWAAENGITNGTGDGTTFEPNATCTRAQIVTMLARYLNGTPAGNENPFVDVPANAYYTDAVLWAVENGITTGTGDGTTFKPNETCTRAQIVTFLFRSLDY